MAKVWKLGNDIDTDIIIPTQFLAMKTVEDMKQYAFYPLRPELPGVIKAGDVIVAGKNFGCGSSREQAPEIIKALGVKCVIAKSFARIFYRNSFNNGLLLIENSELPEVCNEGDDINIDLKLQEMRLGDKTYSIPAIPEDLLKILEAGGLVSYMKELNRKRKEQEKGE
ncbi:MAG: 3-isopropylmalate dehydratase [Bacillota bacterium]|nr:3-isopropylmalate dehydratase [Bacillota bacterium]